MRSTKVLVADANSTDGTPDIVMSFRDRLNVEVIRGGLPSVGRNAGAARAETPYVLFMDADIEPAHPALIRRAMEAAEKKHLHCVTTNILCRGGGLFDNLLYTTNDFFQYLVATAPAVQHRNVHAVRPAALQRTRRISRAGSFRGRLSSKQPGGSTASSASCAAVFTPPTGASKRWDTSEWRDYFLRRRSITGTKASSCAITNTGKARFSLREKKNRPPSGRFSFAGSMVDQK